jgi:hypothetical protein
VVLKIEGRWPWQSFGDHQAIGNAENPVWGDLFIGWRTPKIILFVFQRRGASPAWPASGLAEVDWAYQIFGPPRR